ncbi:MAG: DUF2946 domain-containing protein [Desulfovibrionaceae bacterium]|nr:DUF2946 domain-containing protein [Desulfovibrionaceae bacterium]
MFIFSSSRLRKKLLWLALCAMCLSAVMPTVSRWLAATARAAGQIEVCGEHGMTLVDAPPPQWPVHHQGADGDEDDACGYCTLARHSPGPPAAPPAFALAAPLPAAPEPAADIAMPALRAWRQPHSPQAPPFARA